MKQKMKQIKEYFIVNKKMYLFFTILFIVAIIAGAVFSITLNEIDNDLVTTYLDNYINLVKSKKIIFRDSFINFVMSNTIMNLLVWLLGFSVIGIPIIIFIFFYKCFVVGFAISSIILRYKVKGILFSFLYVFPHHILTILMFMILVIYALTISINIFKAVVKRKEISFKEITIRYTMILFISLIVILLLGLYESYILPKILFIITSYM